MNYILIAKEAESRFNVLSLSENRVNCRISLMFEKIKNQVVDQLKSAGLFTLLLDNFTDVSSSAQLVALICYICNCEFKMSFSAL